MTPTVQKLSLTVAISIALCACADIFHSTDFPTICDTTPTASACLGDAAADASLGPLCAKDSAEAAKVARSTCAKLSACKAVTAHWNVATCLDDAVLALDCAANSQQGPRGARSEFWRCARYATDCNQLEVCLLGGGPPNCGKSTRDYATCASPGVRVLCSAAGGAPVAFESCTAQGRTCVDGVCGGGAASGCSETGCDGTALHSCIEDGVGKLVDFGYDCALSGDGKCRGAGVTSYCAPLQGASCTTTTAVRCEGGIAIACVGGSEQRVNCTSLGLACAGGEVTLEGALSGCKGDIDCPTDSCNDKILSACARRTSRTVDCAAEGLGACTTVSIAGESFARCGSKP